MLKKNFILSAFFVLLTSFGAMNQVFAKGKNSQYFQDVVFQDGGDFLSLLLGETKAEVMSKMPEEALDDEEGSYLYYSWTLGTHIYYIDLYFGESDQLVSIDGSVYFYDKNGKALINEADNLYKDLRTYFVKKFGDEQETQSDGMKYTYWYLENLDVEVGMSSGEVYWYLYDYSYEGYYDEPEQTPVYLSDVGIGQNGKLMEIDLLDSRSKVKTVLNEDDFAFAGLNNLEYERSIDDNYYFVNYVFDENDILILIDAQIDFTYAYDADYYYDFDADYDAPSKSAELSYAEQFYEEMKAYLNERYGTRKEKTIHGDTKTISWRFNGNELVLGFRYENVYWYYSKDE